MKLHCISRCYHDASKNTRLKIRIKKKIPPGSLVLDFAHDGEVIQLLQNDLSST